MPECAFISLLICLLLSTSGQVYVAKRRFCRVFGQNFLLISFNLPMERAFRLSVSFSQHNPTNLSTNNNLPVLLLIWWTWPVSGRAAELKHNLTHFDQFFQSVLSCDYLNFCNWLALFNYLTFFIDCCQIDSARILPTQCKLTVSIGLTVSTSSTIWKNIIGKSCEYHYS